MNEGVNKYQAELSSIKIKRVGAFLTSIAVNNIAVSFAFFPEVAYLVNGYGLVQSSLWASYLGLHKLEEDHFTKDEVEQGLTEDILNDVLEMKKAMNINYKINVTVDRHFEELAEAQLNKIRIGRTPLHKFPIEFRPIAITHEGSHIRNNDDIKNTYMKWAAMIPAGLSAFIGLTCLTKYNLNPLEHIPEAIVLTSNLVMQWGLCKFSDRCAESRAMLESINYTGKLEAGKFLYGNNPVNRENNYLLHLTDTYLNATRSVQLIDKVWSSGQTQPPRIKFSHDNV